MGYSWGLTDRFENLFHVDMFGDEIADEGDFLRVVGSGFDDEIVDFGGDFVAVVSDEKHGERHAADDFQNAVAGAEIAGEDNAGERGRALGAERPGGEQDV